MISPNLERSGPLIAVPMSSNHPVGDSQRFGK